MPKQRALQGPKINLQKIYLKDASFESPKTPLIFQNADCQPTVNLQVNTETTPLDDNTFEVNLTLSVSAMQDEETVYLVEIKQAGVFTLRGFEDKKQLQQILATFCPTNLFPYAREAISNLVEKGGFSQLLLQPINFDALYQEHLKKIEQIEQANTQTTH